MTTIEDSAHVSLRTKTWRDGLTTTRAILDAAEAFFARAATELANWHFPSMADPTLFQLFPVSCAPTDATALLVALGGEWKDDGSSGIGRDLRCKVDFAGTKVDVILHYCAVEDPKAKALRELATTAWTDVYSGEGDPTHIYEQWVRETAQRGANGEEFRP